MATGTLTSTTIASTYKSLLKVKGGANQVLESGSTAHYLEDGDGNDSVLSLSQAFVGIGNEAPLALLSVGAITTLVTDGTTAVTPEGMNVHITEASKYAMGIKNADASGDGLLIQAGDAADDFALRVEDYDSANDLFVVQGGGGVGIGTASPNTLPTSGANALTILSSNSGSNVYGGVLELQNSDADAANDEFGKIEFQNLNAGSSVTGRAIILASTPDGVHNTSQIKFYSMKAGTAKHAVTINSEGGINETGGVLKENLLTNSGFDVWSNSTLEEATGTEMVTNGAFSSDASSWANDNADLASVSGGQSGNCLRVTRTGASTQTTQQGSFATVVGKLYEFSAYVKSGTSGDDSFRVGVYASNLDDLYVAGTTSGSWVKHSFVYESQDTATYIRLSKLGSTAGTMLFDTVSHKEVTPGCVAANVLAMDGWYKIGATTCKIYREHSGSNTKVGSFYSLKVVTTATDQYVVENYTPGTKEYLYERFAGRTVTMGAWIKTSSASVKVIIGDDADETQSTAHTGGGGWEWLEITRTFDDDITGVYAGVRNTTTASTTFYMSQPMFVFGSSIGEGNYTRPQGEIVYLEDSSNYMNSFNGNSFSDTGATTINLEAESDGQIPKGVKAVQWYVITRDSADTAALYFELGGRYYGGAGNDVLKYAKTPFVACDSNGDASYSINASGSSTTDVYLAPMAVQLR